MKRRRVFLLCGAGVVSVVALLFVILRDTPQSRLPLTVGFGGFTNDSFGNPAAVLLVTNHSKRVVNYIIHPAQNRGLAGWPQALPMASILAIEELRAGTGTNHISGLADFRHPSRFPIQFGFSPTMLESVATRVRSAIRSRSVTPIFQSHFPAFSFELTNVVFSEELPVIDADRP